MEVNTTNRTMIKMPFQILSRFEYHFIAIKLIAAKNIIHISFYLEFYDLMI